MSAPKVLRLRIPVIGGEGPLVLNYARVDLGACNVRQLWCPLGTLYELPGGEATNAWGFVEGFWRLCSDAGTVGDPDVQESYLLARLYPLTRKDGARRIVPDARFRSTPRRMTEQAKDYCQMLDQLLKAENRRTLDHCDFHEQTRQYLELPEPSPEARALYNAILAYLFADARDCVLDDPNRAVVSLAQGWDQVMRTWGRRGGFAMQKQVLDILSYESRVAFHRAYSAVWSYLLPGLSDLLELDEPERRFVETWHLAPCIATDRGYGRFYWFHGHVFGLHPAGAMLMQTPTGRRIVGEYLMAQSADDLQDHGGRLRHAMSRAVMVYMQRRGEERDRRKQRPLTVDPAGFQMLEERGAVRQGHRVQ